MGTSPHQIMFHHSNWWSSNDGGHNFLRGTTPGSPGGFDYVREAGSRTEPSGVYENRAIPVCQQQCVCEHCPVLRLAVALVRMEPPAANSGDACDSSRASLSSCCCCIFTSVRDVHSHLRVCKHARSQVLCDDVCPGGLRRQQRRRAGERGRGGGSGDVRGDLQESRRQKGARC